MGAIVFSPGRQKPCTSSLKKKSNISFFFPNGLSNDVFKQTKGTKN